MNFFKHLRNAWKNDEDIHVEINVDERLLLLLAAIALFIILYALS